MNTFDGRRMLPACHQRVAELRANRTSQLHMFMMNVRVVAGLRMTHSSGLSCAGLEAGEMSKGQGHRARHRAVFHYM
jgi:hypothetical protein